MYLRRKEKLSYLRFDEYESFVGPVGLTEHELDQSLQLRGDQQYRIVDVFKGG